MFIFGALLEIFSTADLLSSPASSKGTHTHTHTKLLAFVGSVPCLAPLSCTCTLLCT